MKTIHAKDVNEAFYLGMQHAASEGVLVERRGKMTIEPPYPVATVYSVPQRRVLFNEKRDANPFFHLMESLWIIAGRDDVAFLDGFNSRMKDYSDDGETFHAPYGFRLRHEQDMDQIQLAIKMLKEDPYSRRVVLQIWDANLDLYANTRDIPCNDLIMLKIRDGAGGPGTDMMLDMTVCCRSNDIIWGCYGANMVQFSQLHEYLAMHIGVKMGAYTHVSDSFHIYTENVEGDMFKRFQCEDGSLDTNSIYPLVEYGREAYMWDDLHESTTHEHGRQTTRLEPMQMLAPDERPDQWDADLKDFFALADKFLSGQLNMREFFVNDVSPPYKEIFRTHYFNKLVWPFFLTYMSRKLGIRYGKIIPLYKQLLITPMEAISGQIAYADWKYAAIQWLDRRDRNNGGL